MTKKKAAKKKDFTLDVIADKKAGLSVLENKTGEEEISHYIIPMQHKALNKALGGILGGKFIEISGDSQSGKSFLLYEALAEAIDMGGFCFLLDGEIALEDSYAKMVGLDLKGGHLAFCEDQTESQKKKGLRGEPVVDMDKFFKRAINFIVKVRSKVKKKEIPVVIAVDSFPAMQCVADLKNIADGVDPRGYAAMQKNAKFSYWIEKLIPILDKHSATFILLNQTRIDNKIMYGDKTVTLCENVIKFWATQRIRGKLAGKIYKKVHSLEVAKGKNVQIGMKTEWQTIKNRAVTPFQKVGTKIYYSKGVDIWSGLDELLANNNLIKAATKSFPDPNDEEKKITKKGYKLLDGSDDTFFPTIQDVIEKYPHFLEPKWTGVEDDEIEEIEEPFGNDDGLDFDGEE